MYLKSLTLRGFKSFASATTIRLEPGITCIVGPNGSGKSNVVDALTWVMGEQGAKSLRGANMSDVIFAGTSGRPALGRAQVELTIDNSDGRLPIEYAEVTIARTLFRGGGSEYTINGASVRLLDVQELLSDTGMGKQMHVIVGQGQLDAVLRATPEERRGFIDEAAGVLKHRRRKERTLRKLEAMDANLVRVLDLTDEIKRQLRPLKRQAEAARQAEGVQERINYAQRRLAADDYLQAKRRLERGKAEVEKLRQNAFSKEADLGATREQLAAAEKAASECQQKLQTLVELQHQFESVAERLRSTAALASERLEQTRGYQRRVTETQVIQAQEQATAAESAAAAAAAEVAARQEEYQQRRSQLQAAQQQEERLRQLLREAEIKVERQRQEAAMRREEAVSAASTVAAVRTALEGARNAHRDSQMRLQAEEDAAQMRQDEGSTTPGEGGALAAAHADRVRAEQAARETVERLQALERDLRAEAAGWEGRRDALGQSLPRPADPDATPAGDRLQTLGTLDQAVRTQRGWETAVSSLLAPFETAPVIAAGTDADAVQAGWVTSTSDGQQFLAVRASGDALPQNPPPAPPLGGDGPTEALAVLGYHPQVGAALEQLLRGAWLAPTIASAQKLLDENANVVAVGTREGVVVTRNALRGPRTTEAPSLLLRAQWDAADEKYQAVAQQLAQASAQLLQAQKDLGAANAATAAAMERLREYDSAQALRAQEDARMAAQLSAAQEQERRARAALHAEEQRLEAAVAAQFAADEALAAAPPSDGQEALGPPREALAQCSANTQALRDAQTTAQLELRTAEEHQRTATRTAATQTTHVAQLRETMDREARREESLRGLRHGLQELLGRAESGRVRADAALQQSRQAVAALQREGDELGVQISQLRRQTEDLQWQQNHAGEVRQQAEVALVQAQLQFDQVQTVVHELVADASLQETSLAENPPEDAPEIAALVDQLVAQYGPEQPVPDGEGNFQPYDRATMSATLQEAQRQLGRMGVVNPLAVQEHAALQARYDFLREQVEDLRKSKSDLLQIIEDVDLRVQEAFTSAFQDTQKEFERVFAILFPGGTGRLSLTDPDDPLTTGVEIYARPAGKRVTRLSLLSGGERSLAALAYLVAIFHARPSPFYVMDEVEAALDDVNLSRVLTVMEGLRASSQLIMVTHQKRTMEIADALYGVTMRDGVTQVVSHRMDNST